MKITLEFDPANPGAVTTTAATPEVAPAVAAPAVEAKAEETLAPKAETAKPEPKPKAMAAAMPIPKEEPQSGNFQNMGGICDIRDAQKSNPNVFQYQAPKEG